MGSGRRSARERRRAAKAGTRDRSPYRPAPDAVWDDDVGDGYFPAGIDGPIVCHNDLCVENVVVREGRATRVIDFDYARPVDPLFDIAVAVRHWAPVRATGSRRLHDRGGRTDTLPRVLDVHELEDRRDNAWSRSRATFLDRRVRQRAATRPWRPARLRRHDRRWLLGPKPSISRMVTTEPRPSRRLTRQDLRLSVALGLPTECAHR